MERLDEFDKAGLSFTHEEKENIVVHCGNLGISKYEILEAIRQLDNSTEELRHMSTEELKDRADELIEQFEVGNKFQKKDKNKSKSWKKKKFYER